METTQRRWDAKRIEFEYLLAELNNGRSLTTLASLIVNADIAKTMLEESLGLGRESEKFLGTLLKNVDPDDPIEQGTIELILEEITLCNAIFRVLQKRIRAGEVFDPDERPDARRRKEIVKKWKKWLRTTNARYRKSADETLR